MPDWVRELAWPVLGITLAFGFGYRRGWVDGRWWLRTRALRDQVQREVNAARREDDA